jgi:hypothetical protein
MKALGFSRKIILPYIYHKPIPSDRDLYGLGLRSLPFWDCGFDSRRGHTWLPLDPSPRGVLPIVVCSCVWSRNVEKMWPSLEKGYCATKWCTYLAHNMSAHSKWGGVDNKTTSKKDVIFKWNYMFRPTAAIFRFHTVLEESYKVVRGVGE